jgi:hypothetical protein
MTSCYWFIVGSLGVWRITHLLASEDGPAQAVVRLRRLAGAGFFGQLLDCFLCLSVWVAAPFAAALGNTWRERILLWPALSAAAILLERVTAGRAPAWVEHEGLNSPEEAHSRELLWKDEG